ncbi:phosphate/phosphite/phosphonate ABC transporter substrate-binding protein [Candidatus Magnetaquicoccus inordinatus]|uniref:phosphate/phosphite/phosphonate ABC transporter substrate-binding protein n=1 Tax=Candidatus Magnetaquicoccus inordinatus TaxID=2496818 RepID=UPI00102CD826|nr:phosphate/phosphite/phosphonate ABC transporter substrate-binding protein [Candidatus Magnetaquicoccus inordinatus]
MRQVLFFIPLLALILFFPSIVPAQKQQRDYAFGVLAQRSALLTAQYWNPILEYVARQSGIRLILRTARTAPESNQAIAHGEYDFVYSSTIFQPRLRSSGYQVILKPRATAISGQIVTRMDAPIHSLTDLQDAPVGFPSRGAFVGYALPMDHLLRSGIRVQPLFGGNQEGIMAQLQAGKVVAAGVNEEVMRHFADRESFRYRVLWQSQSYENLPIAVHPRVDPEVARSVQKILSEMHLTTQGESVLQESAQVIKQPPPHGFIPANQEHYRNYSDFYQNTLVADIE